MANAPSAVPFTLSQGFANKLGDLSKFGSVSSVTTCDTLGTFGAFGDRQISEASSCDLVSPEDPLKEADLAADAIASPSAEEDDEPSSFSERGVELRKGEIRSIVQRVVKNSVHAASLMDPSDPDQRLLAVSGPFQEMTGFHERELLQASSRLLFVGCEHEVDPEVQAALRNSHLTGSPLLAQAVNRSKQGQLFWNTMYVRGLTVAVDPASEDPIWFVLTTSLGSEEPPDEDGDVSRRLRGASEALRAEIGEELARCAGRACPPAEPDAGALPGCRGGCAEGGPGPDGEWCVPLQRPRWC